METLRIMMADDNGMLRKTVGEYFSKKQDVEWAGEAADGREALDMLRLIKPDVLLLDVVMPRMDGFAVLSKMGELGLQTKVIMLTALHTEDAIEHAMNLGAHYYMLKPFDLDTLYQRVKEIASARNDTVDRNERNRDALSADEVIANLFMTLGIPAHIKGYQYLRDAIHMVMEEHTLINRITKELYPNVAKKNDTSASKVERAMRHAIEVAWNRGRIENTNRMLGCQVFSPNEKPTNGEFIAMVANHVSAS